MTNEEDADMRSEEIAARVYLRCLMCRWHEGNFKCRKRYIGDGLPVYCSYFEQKEKEGNEDNDDD